MGDDLFPRAVQLIENIFSISASNDYENAIIEIKLLLRPLAVHFLSTIKAKFHE